MEAKLSVVQDGLRSLPESFSENPQGKLLNLCAEFNTRIRECTTGSESYPRFFEGLYDEFEILSKDITATRPNFEIPQKTPQNETSIVATPAILDYNAVPMSVSLPYSSSPAIAESESRSDLEVKCGQQGRPSLVK
jgi:hypothetical protein